MRVTGGRLVELRNDAGPGGRPRAGAVVDWVQLQVLRPNEQKGNNPTWMKQGL